jgi:hypothetical protein
MKSGLDVSRRATAERIIETGDTVQDKLHSKRGEDNSQDSCHDADFSLSPITPVF